MEKKNAKTNVKQEVNPAETVKQIVELLKDYEPLDRQAILKSARHLIYVNPPKT